MSCLHQDLEPRCTYVGRNRSLATNIPIDIKIFWICNEILRQGVLVKSTSTASGDLDRESFAACRPLAQGLASSERVINELSRGGEGLI